MRLKAIISCIVFIAVSAFSLKAITPREAFINAPNEIIEAIDSLTRLDMLDYFDSGSTIASRNAFGGESTVKSINDTAITVATSKASEVTLVVLPISKTDTMMLVINTLALPAPDSHATVYDKSWQPVGKASLPEHNNLDLWLLPAAKSNRSVIENAIPFIPAIYNFNDGTLTVTHTLSRLIPKEDLELVSPYLRPSISFAWNGKTWKTVKQ